MAAEDLLYDPIYQATKRSGIGTQTGSSKGNPLVDSFLNVMFFIEPEGVTTLGQSVSRPGRG